jgi:hypothetical protein
MSTKKVYAAPFARVLCPDCSDATSSHQRVLGTAESVANIFHSTKESSTTCRIRAKVHNRSCYRSRRSWPVRAIFLVYLNRRSLLTLLPHCSKTGFQAKHNVRRDETGLADVDDFFGSDEGLSVLYWFHSYYWSRFAQLFRCGTM